jgi:hypothetical protein
MFFEICKWESRTETAGPDPEIILLDPDPFGFEKPITYEPSRMFEKWHPNPDPPDFGHPGSGSISQRYGSRSESFYH